MNLSHAHPVPEPGARTQEDLTPDLSRIRQDYPILGRTVHGKPLVYLDNAASTQKPRAVLDALVRYYETDNANVHRGVHTLSDRATALYEQSRAKVQQFLNAQSPQEIVFVRGATEGINLVAQCFGRRNVGPGDEVVITWMEHHANIVPWQMLCEEKGASLRVVPITDSGDLRLGAYEKLLTPRTKLVAVTHVSNVLGTVNPIKRMIDMAHERGVPVVVDGAQAVAHLGVDVRDLDCDFYAFSGHKVYGPMGIGVLYGKARHLEEMPPWQGGGEMVNTVTFEKTTYNVTPSKFEAGTPNVAGAVGLAEALDELGRIGRDQIAGHEARLIEAALEQLGAIRGVRLVGEPAHRAGVISFVVEDPPLSALDVGTRLDLEGIAVRTGHHCCQPLLQRFGVPGTVRVSFALYNTVDEVARLATTLRAIVAVGSSAGASGAFERRGRPGAGLPAGRRPECRGGRGGAARRVRRAGRLVGTLPVSHRAGARAASHARRVEGRGQSRAGVSEYRLSVRPGAAAGDVGRGRVPGRQRQRDRQWPHRSASATLLRPARGRDPRFRPPGIPGTHRAGKEPHDRSPEWAGRDGQAAPGARRLPGHATANRPER